MSMDAAKLKMDVYREIAINAEGREEAVKSAFSEARGMVFAHKKVCAFIEQIKKSELSNDKCDEKGIEPRDKELIVEYLNKLFHLSKVEIEQATVKGEQLKGQAQAYAIQIDYLDKQNEKVKQKIADAEAFEKEVLNDMPEIDENELPRKPGQRPTPSVKARRNSKKITESKKPDSKPKKAKKNGKNK